jgi:hypothetical protein
MAVYLINRTVCSALGDQTPEEVWTGKKVDLSQLQIFGSEVMVHVPRQKRRKWDSKSVKLIFVGYDGEQKGYRCINPNSKKLTVSRDVIFLSRDDNRQIENLVEFPDVQVHESDNEVLDAEVDNSNGHQSDDGDLNDTVIVINDSTDSVVVDGANNLSNESTDHDSSYSDADDTTRDPHYVPNYDDIHETSCFIRHNDDSEPDSVREAMSRSDASLWKVAM